MLCGKRLMVKRAETLKYWSAGMLFLLICLVPAATVVIVRDALSFHDLAGGPYKTPWYSTSWLAQPYTNLRLALHPDREYWTMNAIKNERWLVQEARNRSRSPGIGGHDASK